MLEPLICKCCGGHVDRKTLVCGFCGVAYRIKDDFRTVEIRTIERPCEVLCAQMAVDRHELAYHANDQDFSEYIVKSLARGLTDELVKYMEIEKEFGFDPLRDAQIFRARCRVLHPGYKF